MHNIYIELKITEEIIKKLEAVDSNWMKFEKHGG